MKSTLIVAFFLVFTMIAAQQPQRWSWEGNGTDDAVNDVIEYDDSAIVMAGRFTKMNEVSAGGTFPLVAICKKNVSGKWQWQKLGTTNGNVQDIEVFNGALYIGGRFTLAGSSLNAAYGIAKYDGTWSAVTNGGVSCNMNVSTCGVWALEVFNGNLVAGGTFTSISGTPLSNIAAWNGTSWTALGSGISAGSSQDGVRVMKVYNDELYVAGTFVSAGGVNVQNIAKWNGSSWSNVASFTPMSQVVRMQVYNGSLYVGGNFSSVNGNPVNRIAKFDGTTWSDAGQGLMNCGFVNSIAVLDDSLYVAGSFNFPGSTDVTSHVGRWNGSSWEFFGAFSQSFSSGSMATLRAAYGRLYASGAFSAVDGNVYPNIVQYTPAGILAGVKDIDFQDRLVIVPNPFVDFATVAIPEGLQHYTVTIENLLGECVGTVQKDNGFTIVRNDLPAGLYYLSLTKGNVRITKKFVIGAR